MRIAFAHDYSMEHIGGTPTSLLEQKRALEGAGHTVFVIQIGNRPDRPTYDNSRFIYIKPHVIMPESFYKMSYIFANKRHDVQIEKILKENKIEIVHTQSEQTLAFTVVKVAKQLGIPVVSTIHSFYWGELLPGYLQATAPLMNALEQKATRMRFHDFNAEGKPAAKAFKNWTLNMAMQANAVVSPSQHQADDMKKVWPDIPVSVTPNPLRNLVGTSPHLISSKPHVFRLAWAGRVDPEKRPNEFLEAVQIAQRLTKVPFEVDFIGRGSIMQEVLRRHGDMPHVTFHGQRSHKDAVALIDKADALFMSSYHYDNQPMVIAEAISRYRPVIYCDERLTEGVEIAGFLSGDPSPESMAQAIVDFVENPARVRAFSVKAKEASKLFTPEEYVKRIEKVYKGVLAHDKL